MNDDKEKESNCSKTEKSLPQSRLYVPPKLIPLKDLEINGGFDTMAETNGDAGAWS